jgi:phosphate transport system permease protein
MSDHASDRLVRTRRAIRLHRIAGLMGHGVLLGITCASALAVVLILFFIAKDALPFFQQTDPQGVTYFSWERITMLGRSDSWYPEADPHSYGALGIFVGSALVIMGSCLIAVPLGISAAVCLSDVVPFSVRQVVKPVIELLAAIPSVAYGFFALVVFAPLLQDKGGPVLAVAMWVVAAPLCLIAIMVVSDVATSSLPDRLRKVAAPALGLGLAALAFWGLSVLGARVRALTISSGVNALNASIILAIMALPTVVSVCEDALTAVGRDLREGSYALGATRAETLVRVVIPAAKGGILAAVILGIMRAAGETMVVLMAAGNAFEIPTPWYNIISKVRTLTATIALEMGETPVGSVHYHVLFALGFILLVFSFVCNLLSEWAVRRSRAKGVVA